MLRAQEENQIGSLARSLSENEDPGCDEVEADAGDIYCGCRWPRPADKSGIHCRQRRLGLAIDQRDENRREPGCERVPDFRKLLRPRAGIDFADERRIANTEVNCAEKHNELKPEKVESHDKPDDQSGDEEVRSEECGSTPQGHPGQGDQVIDGAVGDTHGEGRNREHDLPGHFSGEHQAQWQRNGDAGKYRNPRNQVNSSQ